MERFYLTNEAKRDLITIAEYTQRKWGVEQRNVYIKQMDDAFHLIGDNPELGVACDYIQQGYKKFPQGSHLIFYRKTTKPYIKIIRILHKRMDVVANFPNQ